MRVLGFSQKWPKLEQDTFTTFRFQRKDKDWYVDEVVQVVYKPRSKEREVLGTAKIVGKEARYMAWGGSGLTQPKVTNAEAIEDGFPDGYNPFGTRKSGYFYMWEWLLDTYGGRRLLDEPMNKITLKWEAKYDTAKS